MPTLPPAASLATAAIPLPPIIQGGMGVAVSGWRLARAVSAEGQLGVVSGTLLPVVLARRLQLGDPEGDLRRAFAAFPDSALVDRVMKKYYVARGKAPGAPFATVPMPSAASGRLWTELAVLANFAEVWLAKLGHQGRVGLNLLEKIQVATLASLYGAMLAGVDVVLMGAGVPRAIPGVLDRFAAGEGAEIPLDVTALPAVSPCPAPVAINGADPTAAPNASASPTPPETRLRFDPGHHLAAPPSTLRRPDFLAIVGSAALATTLARKASGRVDGFVIESHAAGGHNTPPRGDRAPGPDGQPVYGPRDEPELAKFRALGLPFWLGGERASPERLAEARAQGAAGVQVGTAFAFCAESGLDANIKARVCEQSREGRVRVFTDPRASPTGFPFKVLAVPGTLSEPEVYVAHPRRCDLGYLREAYARPDGSVGYRCPAEPVEDYVAKGGDAADCVGRKCLCNGLLAAVGLGQIRPGDSQSPGASASEPAVEPAIVTAGQETTGIARFLAPGASGYSARDVLAHLLAPLPVPAAAMA